MLEIDYFEDIFMGVEQAGMFTGYAQAGCRSCSLRKCMFRSDEKRGVIEGCKSMRAEEV